MHAIPLDKTRLIRSLALVVLVTVVGFSYWSNQKDDAYIFFTYSQNLVEGNGLVFNPGERVNATTSPLYTLLLALTFSVLRWLPGLTLPLLAQILGCVALWTAARLGERILDREGFLVATRVFPFLLVGSPLLYFGVGMETFLTLALVLACLFFYQRHRWGWLGCFCALAVLSRPDAVLVPLLLTADHVRVQRRLPPMRSVILFVLILLPWLVFSAVYYGDLLPSTLGAKLGQTQSGRWGTGLIFLKGLWTAAWPLDFTRWMILAAVVLSGITLAAHRQWMRRRMVWLMLVWNGLFLVVYGFVLNPPAYPWYFAPLSVGTSLVIALAIDAGWCGGDSTRPRRWALVAAVVVLSLSLPLVQFDRPMVAKYEAHREAAEWLNQNAPKGASVGMNEIGVVGYFYEQGPIIDGLGLITPSVSKRVANQEYDWYVKELSPDFLLFTHPHRKVLEAMVTETWFQNRYERVAIIEGRWNLAIWKTRKADFPS